MTIIAVGTALPEIATSIIAAIRKDADLAIGNVIGSNIYNICLLSGIGTTISPISYNQSFNSTIIFLIIATTVVLILTNLEKSRTIGRGKAVILLLLYAVYILRLFA